jgi:hypothetical protein
MKRFQMTSLCRHITLALSGVALSSALSAAAADRGTVSHVLRPFNCNDSGAGSLRNTLVAAVDGDTIDLTQLPCGTITLTTGALVTAVDNLTLQGPGRAALTIDGGAGSGHYDRVIKHTGNGTLLIAGISVADAKYSVSPAVGGCVYSHGIFALYQASVSNCVVTNTTTGKFGVAGGGIYATNGVQLFFSAVSANQAISSDTYVARGGGIFTNGLLTVVGSTIAGNQASAPANSLGVGGGAYANGNGDVLISASTISGNSATIAGGLELQQSTTHSAAIFDSTISGNDASYIVGGVVAQLPLAVYNSTIVFNSAGFGTRGVGIHASRTLNVPVTLQSSIIAQNSVVAAGGSYYYDFGATTNISGANNLITAFLAAPSDTISSCPRLAALADNGGPTLTHVLLRTSPAIDAGNDSSGYVADERGLARIAGVGTDMGALELQPEDVIDEVFTGAFEGRCR